MDRSYESHQHGSIGGSIKKEPLPNINRVSIIVIMVIFGIFKWYSLQ